jgi:ferrous iron transport protein B
MLLTLFYPILLGLFFSILIFTGGSLLGLTGLQAMVAFYLIMLGTAAELSQVKTPEEKKLLTERR